MNRWMLLAALALAIPAPAPASLLPAEMRELAVSGLLDFDTGAGTLVDFDLFFGYFVTDGVEVGLEAAIRDDDVWTFWSAGLRAERNFDLGTEFVPYLGLSLAYGEAESEVSDDTGSAAILGGQVGVKYFLTEYLALSVALVAEAATDDVFPADDGADNTNAKIELGIRCFF